LPPLEDLVKKINASFNKYFSQIACAGEVQLATADDFDKYAIEIRVKFRDEDPMQTLNARVQSGGVRTLIYLCVTSNLFLGEISVHNVILNFLARFDPMSI
jgi:chromosome segregation ATPase